MKPSTFFSVSGVGSYCTDRGLERRRCRRCWPCRSPSKIDWLVPAWMPIVLPARSATVRIGLPSSRDRMQNGFFWKVRADDLQRRALLGDQPGGGVRGREADVDRAGDDQGVGAVDRAGDQVDALEARLGVVALRVGEVLAGELDVLDPGELQRELARTPRGPPSDEAADGAVGRPGRARRRRRRPGAPRLRAPSPLEARKARRVRGAGQACGTHRSAIRGEAGLTGS